MTEETGHKDLFTTTRWTMVLRAGDRMTSASALEELCRIYWYPLYAYVRGRGYSKEDAEDLTQGFFAGFLEACDFAALKSEQGRFRGFLLASMKNYIANEYDRGTALKRGGGSLPLSLDWKSATRAFELMDATALSPEEIYDREWALSLLRRVLERLRNEWARKNMGAWFDTLEPFISADRETMRYDEIAEKLGVSEGNLRVSVHRLRKQYRKFLKDEIAQTLSDPEMVDEELDALLRVFS